MSTTSYRQYVEEIMALARSLVIKSSASAISINKYMNERGFQISTDDPLTWKYYLNLSGQYHDYDESMNIISLDTGNVIPFTISGLEGHVLTKQFYKPGMTYYNEVVAKYPEQEVLIRGILNPIDIEVAIAAPDFSILHYDDEYVESNELNLITQLNVLCDSFNKRWNNPNYSVSDDLYVTANLAVLHHSILTWILNIRLENCKTRHAHSFHIKEYLKSHGRLDSYLEYLTKSQMLFLYRNILYIERNVGKNETFEWLIENILTNRGIGLAEFNLHHNLEDLLTVLQPSVEFIRKPFNKYHTSSRIESHSFSDLLDKEDGLARRNEEVKELTILNDTDKIINAKRATFTTKLLESAIIDWDQRSVVTRIDFLLNHWLHWSVRGTYIAKLNITHPRTGDVITMNARDAFITFIYSYNKAIGIELTDIPDIVAVGVRKQPTPDIEKLRSIVDSKYVSDKVIELASNSSFYAGVMVTPNMFIEVADELYNNFYAHREAYALQEHYISRGQVQGLMDHLYMNINAPLDPEKRTYSEWWDSTGFRFNDLTNEEHQLLTNDLLDKALGLSLNKTHSATDIQKSLIKLMTQLSSYCVHYTTESNPSLIYMWDWPAIRLGDIGESRSNLDTVRIISDNFREADGFGSFSVDLELNDLYEDEFGVSGKASMNYEVKPKMEIVEKRKNFIQCGIGGCKINVISMSEIPL